MIYLVQIIMAGLGALGYSVLFNTRRDKLIFSVLGSMLCWSAYILASQISDNTFITNMIAAAVGTLYAEILARIKKAPTTCFLIPTVIPLVPGGGLFYTISAAINGNKQLFQSYLITTMETAFGISIGIMLMSLVGVKVIKKINNTPFRRENNEYGKYRFRS